MHRHVGTANAKSGQATGQATGHAAANPIGFVGGCPRSGTSLLQQMLDRHPDLACGNDTHFIIRVLERYGPHLLPLALLGAPVPLANELVAGVLDYHRFSRLGIDRADVPILATDLDSYDQLVTKLYDAFAARNGKRFALEKTPDFVLRLPLLSGLFPDRVFVNLVRDGRDVALSLLDWATPTKGPGKLGLWKSRPLAAAALWWRDFVLVGRRDGPKAYGNGYIEVTYEALVSDPWSQLERIVAGLPAPLNRSRWNYSSGDRNPLAPATAKKNLQPPTLGIRNWRTSMDQADVALFEFLAGDALELFGYERTNAPLTDEILAAGQAAQAWWCEHEPCKASLPSQRHEPRDGESRC